MATAEFGPITSTSATTGPQDPPANPKPLHRVRDVRMEQGMTLRSAARNMSSDVRTLRAQEQAHSDMRLSELRRWQKVLDVPLIDLLEEGDAPLSRPVMERARMIRLMKTAMAIHEKTESVELQRMSQMMVEQLVEIMPELEEVSAWHTYGQRRGLEDYGRVFERRMADDVPGSWDD